MPCDNINRVTKNEDGTVAFEMTSDIHAQYWTKRTDGSTPYYRLRKCVMDGMLDDTALNVQMPDNAHYVIMQG